MSNRRDRWGLAFALALAAVVFWLAFDSGTYGLQSRSLLAIVVWWTILVASALGILPLRPTRTALAVGGLLATFAAWTLTSLAWSESAEKTFAEFDRVALFLGVYLLVVFVASPGSLGRWCDGLAVGIAAVGLLALAARLFPAVFPGGDVPEALPSAEARLSWPVEYWNGLALLVALGIPLLLRAALESRRELTRALALALLPALGAAVYLTSSRGGVLAALVGALAFLLLTDRRWSAAAALLAAAAGSAGAIAVLLPRDELVNGPLDSDAAASQGATAALLLVLVCVATALAFVLAGRALRDVHPPLLAGRLAALVGLVLIAVALAASSPAQRFADFKEPPPEPGGGNFVQGHLASGSGSGRWQYWTAAVDSFETAPLHGHGAGSYEAWWTQHGTLDQPVNDAHSLYLEALAELGLVGFLVLVTALGIGVVVGFRRTLDAGPARTTVAALAASLLAYLVAAGIDWMWELTVVSVVGIASLALLTGPAAAFDSQETPLQAPSRLRRAGLAAGLLATWLLICAQAVPLLAETKIEDSQAAVRRGDLDDAVSDAAAARVVQPWAASPYFQLALVEEARGDLEAAQDSIGQAIARDSADWRLWLVAARIETRAGHVAEARESLGHARELNPRSRLLRG
jgi:O-antigen ligase